MDSQKKLEKKHDSLCHTWSTSSPPDAGWSWVVLTAAFISGFISDGLYIAFGVILPDALVHFNSTMFSMSWIGSVHASVRYVVGPFAVVLGSRIGFRSTTIWCTIVSTLSLCACVFANHYIVLIFLFGVGTGSGLGVVYVVSLVVILDYFDRYRSIAVGIVTAGSGLIPIFAPITAAAIASYTWRGAFWILGGITAHLMVCAVIFRPLSVPKKEDNLRVNQSAQLLQLGMLWNLQFMLVALSSAAGAIGQSATFYFLVGMFESLGINLDVSSNLEAASASANVLSRVLIGFLANYTNISVTKLYAWILILGGLSVMFVTYSSNLAVLGLISCSLGVVTGCFNAVVPLICMDIFGDDGYSSAFGLSVLFRGIGTIGGVPLAGYLKDTSGDFTYSYYFAGLTFILAGILCIPLPWLPTGKKTAIDYDEVP